MSWRTSVRTSLVYLVAIACGFAIAYLVVAFVIFPAGVIPRDVKVPNVIGLMYDDAAQRLAQAGFKTEQGEQRFDNSAPKNTVLDETPPPGSKEGIGNTITLAISGGQRLVTVPPVSGMTREDAQSMLEKLGLDVGDVSEQPSTSPRGQVIATRPAGGSQIAVPSTIALVISGGQPAIQMPSLVGRDADQAKQTLNQLGARDVQIVFDPMAIGPRNSIVGQTPVAGATLSPGAPVILRVVGEAATP